MKWIKTCLSRANYILCSVTLHETSYIYTYIFDNVLYPTIAVQKPQHMDENGCCTFSSRTISMFIFNILQLLSRSIQICWGCIAPTCTPLATGLYIIEHTDVHSHLLENLKSHFKSTAPLTCITSEYHILFQ